MRSKSNQDSYILKMINIAAGCNSASFYIIATLIPLFFVDPVSSGGCGFSHEQSLQYYGTFFGMAFLQPLIGGILSDTLLGPKKTFFSGIISLAIGVIILHSYREYLWLALLLIALGYGINRNSLTTAIGEIKYAKNDHTAYRNFHLSASAGFITSTFLGGYIYTYHNFNMVLKIVFIILTIASYAGILIPSSKHKKITKTSKPIPSSNFQAKPKIFITILFISAPFFACFVQMLTSMSYFIHDHMYRYIGNFEIPTTWLNATGSILVLLLNPWIASHLKRDYHNDFDSELSFIRIGMGLSSIAFLLLLFCIHTNSIMNKSILSMITAVPTFFLFSLSDTIIRPQIFTAVNRYIKSKYRATANGISFIGIATFIKFGSYIASYCYVLGFTYFFTIMWASSTLMFVIISIIKQRSQKLHKTALAKL